ncbi:MAG: exodeoxyribonuclease III [Bacteroidia bacterium]|nr:exodeoxyribonuclease III [Bacteroidia bacterium]
MKIITYNVNGLRSAISKGLYIWIKNENPDIIALQEIKTFPENIGTMDIEMLGYQAYWFPAKKPGYSGVAVFTKLPPQHVQYGCENDVYDNEGRFILLNFGDFVFINAYHPSGSSGEERQVFKMKWLDYYLDYVNQLKKQYPKMILSGDYNICHKPIDIHSPEKHEHMSGFLPEERAWFDKYIETGYVDAFRIFNQQPHQYTWWSYRANARAKNLGWRIDYHIVSQEMKKHLKNSVILSDVMHSDHCPVVLEIE